MDEKTLLADSRRKNWFWDFNDIFDSTLSANAILVRLYLARCADNTTRRAFPSMNNIAEHCKISRATVKRAINELIEKGWLCKETRKDEEGDYASNLYTLCEPPQEQNDSPDEGGRVSVNLPCNEMTPPSDPLVERNAGGWVHSDPRVGSQRTDGWALCDPRVGSQRATNNTNYINTKYEQNLERDDTNSSLRSELVSSLRTPNSGGLEELTSLKVPEALFEEAPGGSFQSKSPKTDRGEGTKEKPGEALNSEPLQATPGRKDSRKNLHPGAMLTNCDLIAALGDSLREVYGPPAKAYAIAGRLYNLYDFPAAESAINTLKNRMKNGHKIKNPVPYLMKIAREKKAEFESETKPDEGGQPKLFSRQYPEEDKKRIEEVKKIYAERERNRNEYLSLRQKAPKPVAGFASLGDGV